MTPRLARQVALLRWSCALVLGTAAAAKLLDFAAVTGFLAGQMGPAALAAPVAAALLIAVEALAAGWLVSPRHASRGGALAALLGVSFLSYRASSAASSGCPCFGIAAPLDATTGTLIGLMLSMCGATVALVSGSASAKRLLHAPVRLGSGRWRPAAAAVVGLAALAGGFGGRARPSTGPGGASAVPPTPPPWLVAGETAPAIPLEVSGTRVTLPKLVGDKRAVVSFVAMGCAACRLTLLALAPAIAAEADVRWVIIVPSKRDVAQVERTLRATPRLAVAADATQWSLQHEVPLSTHLLLERGRLVAAEWTADHVNEWLARTAKDDASARRKKP